MLQAPQGRKVLRVARRVVMRIERPLRILVGEVSPAHAHAVLANAHVCCRWVFSWHVAMAKRQKSKKKLTPVLGRTFAGPGLHYSWGGVFAWVTFQVRSPEKLFGYREIKA